MRNSGAPWSRWFAAVIASVLWTHDGAAQDFGPQAEAAGPTLAVLDIAGTPASQSEVRQSQAGAAYLSGDRWFAMRYRARTDRAPDLTGTMSHRAGHWHVRGRWRRPADESPYGTGFLGWDGASVSVLAGRLGLRHGFGMLVAAPGRSPSPAADQSLGVRPGRLAGWAGLPDARVFDGLGVTLGGEGWSAEALVARPALSPLSSPTEVRYLRLARRGAKGEWAGAAYVAGQDRAGSLAFVRRHQELTVSGEVVVGPGRRDGRYGWAAGVCVRWQPRRQLQVEFLGGSERRPQRWSAGARLPVAFGNPGHGYALRGAYLPAPGAAIKVLLNEGWSVPATGPEEPSRKRVVAVEGRMKTSPNAWLEFRYRRSSNTGWERPPRHPWLPSQPIATRLYATYAVLWRHQADRWRVSVQWRSRTDDVPVAALTRTLLGGEVRRAVSSHWELRVFSTTAWGESVDLVSAVVPIAGVVWPRHWGRWRSETGLGLSLRSGRARLDMAVGVRHPVEGTGERDDVWLLTSCEFKW